MNTHRCTDWIKNIVWTEAINKYWHIVQLEGQEQEIITSLSLIGVYQLVSNRCIPAIIIIIINITSHYPPNHTRW